MGHRQHNVWNKWPEHVQQTDRSCERNDYCKHVDQMAPEYLLQHEHFYKTQAAQERDMKTDVNSPRIGFFCTVLVRVCVCVCVCVCMYRGCQKKSIHILRKEKTVLTL